jgi:integrase
MLFTGATELEKMIDSLFIKIKCFALQIKKGAKNRMPREKKGQVKELKNGKFQAIFRYKDALGITRTTTKVFATQRKAEKFCEKQLEREEKGLTNQDKLTFAATVERFKDTHFKPAKIIGGKKVAGLKSFNSSVKYQLEILTNYFGKAKLHLITASDVERYKLTRLETPITLKDGREKQRTIASVNRELALLRRIFNLAVADRLIDIAPKFSVEISNETERKVFLTIEQENRLIAACEHRDKRNRQTLLHLRPVLIFLLDTGTRRGEAFKATWQDVNFEQSVMLIREENCKTATSRLVPLSPRVRTELSNLYLQRESDAERIFKFGDIKRGWKSLCRQAGIENLRVHDLRHVAATRLINAGVGREIAMQIIGHKEVKTFKRYTNFSATDLVSEYQKVNAYNEQQRETVH